MARKKGKSQQFLAFVDTNVLLDLYRVRGDSTIQAMSDLLQHTDRLISTSQVRAEFRRNRLNVLASSLKTFEANIPKPTVPAMFTSAQVDKDLDKAHQEYRAAAAKVREKLLAAIKSEQDDPAVAALAPYFALDGDLHLSEKSTEYPAILERAKTRVALGNPPKKAENESLGDAINWEWCLEICRRQACDLVVVTRDGDYGQLLGQEHVPNSYLQHEFAGDIGTKRRLVITPRVGDALKLLGVSVSRRKLDEEMREVENVARRFHVFLDPIPRPSSAWVELNTPRISEEQVDALFARVLTRAKGDSEALRSRDIEE